MVTHTYPNPGTYPVTLTATNSAGTSQTTQNVTVTQSRNPFSLTLTIDTFDFILNPAKVPDYVAGRTDMTLTIAPGIKVGSSGGIAFDVSSDWSPGDTVTIVNSGSIYGRGGNGGNGERYDSAGNPVGWVAGGVGGDGTTAIRFQRPVTIQNNGVIAGGGGGGGGGGGSFGGGGGGGGQGHQISSGGNYGYIDGNIYSQAGNPGNASGPGQGGYCGNVQGTDSGYYGGDGGAFGQPGTAGESFGAGGAGVGLGGNAGAAVVGNANATWLSLGSRIGAIIE